jgi:hypothetical protein
MTDGHLFCKRIFANFVKFPRFLTFDFVRFVKKELDDPSKFQKTYPDFGICNFAGLSGLWALSASARDG